MENNNKICITSSTVQLKNNVPSNINEITKYAKKLYETMINNRDNMSDVLEKMNSYSILKQVIIEIEKKYENIDDVWHDICMGKLGNQTNKCSAIFEVPTKELIDTIAILFQIFNIKKIDEVGAGIGLLSSLLQKKFKKDDYDVKLLASDDGSSDNTNIPLDFTTIIKKDISDIIIQHNKNLNPPEAIICTWPKKTKKKKMEKQFIKLLNTEKIKIFVFTNDIRHNFAISKNFETDALKLGYKIIKLPIRQISYLDFFSKNQFKKLISRSFTFLVIRKDLLDIDIISLLSDNLYKYTKIDPIRIALQDLAITKKIPFWICTLEKKNDLKTAMGIYNSVIKNRKIIQKKIPNWIPNLNLLIFWYTRINKNRFPLKIKTEKKLIEYYNKIINMTPFKLSQFIKDGIVPKWMTYEYVDKYFWLIHSVPKSDNGKWKENVTLFNRKFKKIYLYSAGPQMNIFSNLSNLSNFSNFSNLSNIFGNSIFN